MVADPSCACEITLQPVRRYGVDCAILFSDIMTIPIALGMEVEMRPGPYFPRPLESDEDVEKLAYNPAYMNDVYAALKLVRAELDPAKAVVGFCGAPWTCVAYMVGKDKAKAWAHKYPHRAHAALRKCTAVAIDFLIKQYHAGADVLQVFESQAADLGPNDFRNFALPYLTEIAREVKRACPHAPMTVFPRGAAHYATRWIAQGTEYDCVSVDWGTEPKMAREMAGEDLTLQGNLEPDVLYEPVENIRKEEYR
ncbi:uroporphyrinogen decarboxylase [Allomyces macrogynus ATCC 38327]|uniref:Uroporphyrinogen decarboxylase n=1 Tax=Allomyces macrogynus (strain ATCC 38327) TaxID=578462 RepID=A0A0L0S9W8_ALLM3|nr:uroporphyrinogen decarboxylase [Allomyces macrogynus ATCC 38327]|eukprot:KNE59393.1 uroporphyrinogen decarboxylase [Allomyces macrogynus ATCC 38327]